MDKDRIEALVDEEIARRQIGVAFEPRKKKSIWEGFFRHPLFLTVFAFLVSTVIGGYYDNVLKARADAKENAEAAIAELEEFAQLIYERQIRTDLVRSAIVRGNRAEAVERKKAYDKIFIQWNTDLHANLLALRYHLGSQDKTIYDETVQKVIIPAFQRSDRCLTAAYDISFRAEFPVPPLSPEIAATGKCGAAPENGWALGMLKDKDWVRGCMNELVGQMIPLIRDRANYTQLPSGVLDGNRTRLAANCKEPGT